MEFPDKKYNIIYVDPPWNFQGNVYQDGGRPNRKLIEEYPTMTLDELKGLPINKITADDCLLFMWVADAFLDWGIDLMKSWGFKFSTIAFVWVKKTSTNKVCSNIGYWIMKNCEICMLGMKGHCLKFKKNNRVKQLIEAERKNHSQKPDEARIRIVELLGDIPRIELFARQRFDGWDSWGNELSKTIQKHIIEG